MKKLIWYEVTAVVVGLAATMSRQSESADSSSSSSSYIQASKLVGRKVRSSEGKEIGVMKDIVIDRDNGCMAYTVLSTGGSGTGVISGGGKLVAVPWTVYSATSDLNVLVVNVSRDKIYNAPTFDYMRKDEYARPDYMDNVYSYYGVSPGPRTPAAASGGPTVGTDVTGTAGATANPGEVAPPAAVAAGSDSPSKKPSAHTHASSAASPDEASTTQPSPKATRSARESSTRQRTGRGETESATTIDEFPSESTTSPSENKKSRRKAIQDTSTRTRNATPQSADEQD